MNTHLNYLEREFEDYWSMNKARASQAGLIFYAPRSIACQPLKFYFWLFFYARIPRPALGYYWGALAKLCGKSRSGRAQTVQAKLCIDTGLEKQKYWRPGIKYISRAVWGTRAGNRGTAVGEVWVVLTELCGEPCTVSAFIMINQHYEL